MDQETIDFLQQDWLEKQAEAHPWALQIGCGMKRIEGAMNTDPNPDRERWTDRVADAHDLPFCDGVFGSVVSSHVINALRDPHVAFMEMARVLRFHGHICHVIPDWRYAPDRLSSHHPFEKMYQGWLGPEEFYKEIMAPLSGVFEVVKLENFTEFNWSFKLVAFKI